MANGNDTDVKKIFNEIYVQAQGANARTSSAKSLNWYRKNVNLITGRNISRTYLMASGKDMLRSDVTIGNMYMFFYNAKHRDTLPYWHRFPLIYVIELYKDSALGINLHYLPPQLRAVIMAKLLALRNNKNNTKKTRLIISYQILKSLSGVPFYQACIKRYLYTNVRSKFLKVNAKDWPSAVFLPVEQFEKKTKKEVWRDTILKYGKK